MKEKILNKISIDDKGKEINIEVFKTEKGIVIKINGNEMDVFVNNEVVYSLYEKEEFKYVPRELRSFVDKYITTYSDGITKKGGKVFCQICLNSEDYYLIMPTNRAKSKNVQIEFILYEKKLIEENLGINIKKYIDYDTRLKEIKDVIKRNGYELKYSTSGNEYDNYYCVEIPISDFNEEKILDCFSYIKKFNIELYRIIRMKDKTY